MAALLGQGERNALGALTQFNNLKWLRNVLQANHAKSASIFEAIASFLALEQNFRYQGSPIRGLTSAPHVGSLTPWAKRRTNMQVPHSKSRECFGCDARKDNIFCDLPDDTLAIINASKIISNYRRGQFVFYAGNFPAGLYCVSNGVIRLETEGSSGNGHILRVIQSGGVLGYRSLFADEPYEANAVVHDDATVCLIPKTAIMEIVEKQPAIAMKLLAQVSKELREAEARLCGHTDKSAAERVAEALLFLKEKFSEQNWTRKEISEWAGTTTETVIRTLADFESQGMIEQSGRKIKILKRKELLDFANLSF